MSKFVSALPSALRAGTVLAGTVLVGGLAISGCGPEAGSPEAGGPTRVDNTDPHITAVETSLSAPVRIRGRDPERFSIQERMEHYRVPGASVAVIEGGAVAWAKGYGVKDTESGEPVTPETLFQAASISKPVTAVAALRLVEEGRLDLDAPANRYLTSWQIPDNEFTARQPVTVRHLLTHTGGLTVHGFPGYAVTDPTPTTAQVLDGSGPANTDPIRVDTLPGSLWRYSGGGYTVLQLLLEDVTGEPFPELMRRLVLDPVGMPISSYAQPLPPGRASYAATGHLSDGTPVEGKWHVYPEMAAAGLWTNPTELARLALELQAAWKGETDRVLSPEMTRAMLTPGPGRWGLGFGIQEEGDTRFVHGGSNHGFKAQFEAFVEGARGVVVMTNGDRGSQLAQEIVRAVAEVYEWPVPGPRTVDLAELPPEAVARIEGRFEAVGARLVVTLSAEGNHLRMEVGEGGEEALLYPLSRTRFIDLESGQELQAVREEAGLVTELRVPGGVRAVRMER